MKCPLKMCPNPRACDDWKDIWSKPWIFIIMRKGKGNQLSWVFVKISIFSIFELCRRMLSGMVFFQLVTAALYISGVNFELETVDGSQPMSLTVNYYSLSTQLGGQSSRYENIHCIDKHHDECRKYFLVLLRGNVHNGAFSTFFRYCLRIALVQISPRITKVFANDYSRRTSSTGIWWIWNYGSEFGGFCEGIFFKSTGTPWGISQ